MLTLPPLSLYIHIPWCVQKCPYCDFNSHGLKGEIPETEYITALLDDLKLEAHYVQGRPLTSIFIGGGTPSLLSAEAMARLLAGVEQQIPFAKNIEITMEANPGTVETARFAGFIDAGVNRISIGVQSFQQPKLNLLGRIHGQDEAVNAAKLAKASALNSFNLDLMHGLPDQNLSDALFDLSTAIELAPPHLSWYQLTIEPNTQFASKPPTLPDDDILWDIYEQGHQRLTEAGYVQYEISGYAKPGKQCQHNLNYWRFGDYLGIGCGAHGKITLADENKIIRTTKVKHPSGYLDPNRAYLDQLVTVAPQELPFEYMMNRLRLFEAFDKNEFSERTGQPLSLMQGTIDDAIAKGLLLDLGQQWQVSPQGHRYLNELLALFMDDE
ncbi:radical SAM family heme chaperone HemW [Motilimonas eburnea]|uniref:radical SAM family heme chaperone HemW n=1 Tax=Motilimonas eburnea TaxID=1737488 RepID=UPI001E598B91|nr:radical SAM family heme chaperone HemW [Motilimonas eburnea]MCE2571379.1 radical SAM family heme chaperone HemW [Motilimonas eburnea]